ncbi:NAD(P)-dependent alcohol dehydrogenase [Gordonia sp. LSe1-13]|uniref:alcohol dehydrogenase (NADP(+)) n=1 Tax=Gordonia sesuvii TaxID=3116777 RepID=A0ABU7MIS2_9ACTN|nr:NAD(P)-dependent alcohol dehydrogenase [Gordonia sp. LSe1-13]
MINVNARSVSAQGEAFKPVVIERRDPGPLDVLIDIDFCGVCHSDVSHTRHSKGTTRYPIVPGHEIVGRVTAVGAQVSRFAVGDRAGVGCMVYSCRECESCKAGMEQYCRHEHIRTYNGILDGEVTLGGYSEQIVVDENYVIPIPDSLTSAVAAPLLCAGITMYSPLRHWQVGPGSRVAIVGFGGLGHVGVQISAALGAHTTVLDIDDAKRADAMRLGADDYRLTTDPEVFTELTESFDLILSTVPAALDYDGLLGLLARDGTFVNLGVPKQPISIDVYSLLRKRRSMSGARIGSIAETREMLEFCGAHGIAAEIEMIDADGLDEAFDRVERGDVRYRFVLDVKTMSAI